MNKVTLPIEKLGGIDDFRIVPKHDLQGYKSRYVCTYFADHDEDEFSEKDYDIYHITDKKDEMNQEYIAIEC